MRDLGAELFLNVLQSLVCDRVPAVVINGAGSEKTDFHLRRSGGGGGGCLCGRGSLALLAGSENERGNDAKTFHSGGIVAGVRHEDSSSEGGSGVRQRAQWKRRRIRGAVRADVDRERCSRPRPGRASRAQRDFVSGRNRRGDGPAL